MASSLDTLDLGPGSDSSLSGLVAIRGARKPLNVAEEAALREAAQIASLDYVYFRRFNDGRSSQVAAYVIDNENERFSEAELAQVHKEVWLNGSAPLLYVGWSTRVDLLSCARGPDFWIKEQYQYSPAVRIPTPTKAQANDLFGAVSTGADVSGALQRSRYSAHKLSDGTFWEDPENAKLAKADKAAHSRLIEAVVSADEEINGKEYSVLRRLLLLTVLVKYLEDRKVFPNEGWFGRFHKGARGFFDLLKKGTVEEVLDFLSFMERKFNGDVFALPKDGAQSLTTKGLRKLAELVESRTLDNERYLWEQYSFEHLPVEVLSHLYQRFAQSGDGAIYTPPLVASLLLDYAMPYDKMTGKERVLDPTCGSGIFLVGAFRRLVNHWRSQHNWDRPDVATLKQILKSSIFGVELQGEALHLAAFNLALAVCDALRPEVIWTDLRFDHLYGSNLQEADFFHYVDQQPARFDLVIGNPPFKSALTPAGVELNKKAVAERGRLPDQQAAYLIAEQASHLLEDHGRLCLVLPSGILYNEKSKEFQQRLFKEHQTDWVLDFTSIRGLFDEADTKASALIWRKAPPIPAHRVVHLTFRRTVSVEEEVCFELDHYDRHVVSQHQAVAVSFTWKVNLLGGGRLHHLAARLQEMGTLKEFIDASGWNAGEGFTIGTKDKQSPAKWLTGVRYLPSEALTEKGITGKLSTVTETLFERPRTPDRYKPPLCLIRENERLQCTFWNNGILAYRSRLVGIRAPEKDSQKLMAFSQAFQQNNDVLRAFCLFLGTQALVSKATALTKTDIENLPWPRLGESWDLVPWEKALCDELVDVMADYVRLGQESKLLKQAVTAPGLELYAETFCAMLTAIYPNLKAGRSLAFEGLACQSFYFGDQADLDWPEDWTESLKKLVYVRNGPALRTIRVLRLYQSNVIMIVKPDRLRYWIRSTAIRDADDSLAELHKQGY